MTVGMTPVMDDQGLIFFKKHIELSSCFLEYGSGGSTSYAANTSKVQSIISVDTSKEWLDNVKNSLSGLESQVFLNHCDLGPVGDWGTPINRDQSSKFWQYMVTPWRVAEEKNLKPDTILIDGRFRVACFLYSLLSARVGSLIMFDDYFDRPHYFVVENFCKLNECHGRMAVFYVEHNYSITKIVSSISEYSTNWA
jgi:hypothetical protein